MSCKGRRHVAHWLPDLRSQLSRCCEGGQSDPRLVLHIAEKLARTNTTAPRFVGKHARARYTDWLAEDARRRTSAAAAPALNCADLAAALRADPDAAYARLAGLGPARLTMQAVCYAAYANELLGLELRGEDVLAFWRAAFVRRGLSDPRPS